MAVICHPEASWDSDSHVNSRSLRPTDVVDERRPRGEQTPTDGQRVTKEGLCEQQGKSCLNQLQGNHTEIRKAFNWTNQGALSMSSSVLLSVIEDLRTRPNICVTKQQLLWYVQFIKTTSPLGFWERTKHLVLARLQSQEQTWTVQTEL